MNEPMTPRERVEAALLGQSHDRVPFTVHLEKLPRGAVERELRNEGLCLVQRSPSVFHVETPRVVEEQTQQVDPDGVARIRTVWRTPVGVVTTAVQRVPVGPTPLDRQMGWTTWTAEFPFKGPADYGPLEFLIRDRCYTPNYEEFAAQDALVGGDAIMRAGIGYSPLQEIIYRIMGVERFAFEWAERRTRLLALYDALTDDRRKQYPIVAASPALITNYGGNVCPEVVGRDRFERYILPHYDEAADVFHAHGKLLGVHFDANVRALAPGIARSRIDYVEAFTPAPGSDMTVAEACAAWPDKALWIHFPSPLFLQSDLAIEETSRRFVREAAPCNRFLIGITEDMPSPRMLDGCRAILRALRAGA
ncbi:MAG: hypothetical protein GX601_03255 [Anaerolineales bacterium]|nr:hypothetical protein [Anaerolineales bacterium]